MMKTLWQDLRYGFRMLRKSPGFTAAAVLALALGIGANTAIFSVLNSVLLRSLRYQDRQVVLVWAQDRSSPQLWISPAEVMDLRQQSTLFDGFAALTDRSFVLTGSG